MQRPRGITFLAALNYFDAVWLLALGIAALIGPRALDSLSMANGRSASAAASDVDSSGHLVAFSFVLFVISILIYLVARALWRLRNWARVLVLVFTILSLIGGGGTWLDPLPSLLSEKLVPTLWPHSILVTSGIIGPLLSRFASLILLVYLLSGPVKQAFLANPTEWKWMLAVGAFALLLLGHDVYKSRSELKAIQYHLHHGDRVTVNGVSFPVYVWHVPKVDSECPGFTIDDEPGPLRPNGKNGSMYLTVLGYKSDDKSLTVDQLVQSKLQSFAKSGYRDLSTFHLQVANQSLSCMKEHLYASAIYCYGDGPIYSVHFSGGEDGLTRFNQMMAGAKQGSSAPPINQNN